MQALERADTMLRERIAGATFASIGGHHRVSEQRAHKIVVARGEEVIDELEAVLTDGTGEPPLFLLDPYGPAQAFSDGLRFVSWAFERLQARGHDVRLTYWEKMDGLGLMVEPVVDELAGL